jgi:phosphatidylglycerophosphate synthase
VITQAVVLATDPHAPLRRVAGLSLVKRTLLTLRRGGIERALVVAPDVVQRAVAADGDYARAGLAVELAGAPPRLSAPFLLARADHVFEPALVARAARAELDGVDAQRFAGMDGLLAATPAVLERLDDLAAVTAREEPVGDVFWQKVDSPEAQARAERGLFQLLRKRVDGPVARLVNRPISLAVTRQIIDTGITPNQMSLFAGAIGLAGVALVLAAGGWGTLLLGALLLQLQSILDGCDGELARLKFQQSKLGEWLDNVTDDVLNILYCAALGVAAARFTGTPWLVWPGYAGAVGFAIYCAVLYHQLATVHRSGNPFLFRFWFQREGEDLKAALERPGLVTRASAFFRAIGRRDAFILLFVGLILVRLPHIAALWYAVVGVMNGGVCVVHTIMIMRRRA